MKKITLLLLLLTSSIFGYSQTFDFTNSDDGWNDLNKFTAVTGATYYTVTTENGNGMKKNPYFESPTAGIDTSVRSVVGITIRNNGSNGPGMMRVSYPDIGTGRIYKDLEISVGDTEFVTYWFDLSNTGNWVGIMNDIRIHFKSTGNTDYFLPNSPDNASIDFDKIEFPAAGIVPKTSYDFANDGIVGFAGLNQGAVADGGTTLDFTTSGTGLAPRFAQTFFNVDASSYQYAHIVVKSNASNANQIKFQFEDGSSTQYTYTNKVLNVVTPIDINLSGKAEWTGVITDWRFVFSNSGDANVDTGLVEISEIIFDNDAVLAIDKVSFKKEVSLTLYPNPVNDVLNINSPLTIKKVEVFNLFGQKTLTTTSARINTSILAKGVYVLKVETDLGNRVLRFLKE